MVTFIWQSRHRTGNNHSPFKWSPEFGEFKSQEEAIKKYTVDGEFILDRCNDCLGHRLVRKEVLDELHTILTPVLYTFSRNPFTVSNE